MSTPPKSLAGQNELLHEVQDAVLSGDVQRLRAVFRAASERLAEDDADYLDTIGRDDSSVLSAPERRAARRRVRPG